jgi:DNA-binding response OmpR family regulator
MAKPTLVLLMAGDPLTGLLAESGLTGYGYDVLVARDAADAMDILRANQRIRVLVVDADLVSRLNFAKAARSLDAGLQVIYTSRLPHKLTEQDKVRGAPCLRAPYHPHQLVGVIGGLIGRRSTDDEAAAA